ncbi:MAG: diguanylate cyclase [Pseudomonadota bacterium]
MHFPLLRDIATTEVVAIDINNTAAKAIEQILANQHRDIIILDNGRYYIMTVLDILNIRSQYSNLDIALKDLGLTQLPTIYKEQSILETLSYIQESVEHICVLNENNQLFGLVTQTDIISHIDPHTLMDNYRLSDFLKMGRRMKWVSKNIKTVDILKQMALSKFDNVVIVENKKPTGILTTKDIIFLIKNDSNLELTVEHYMSSPVDSIRDDASVKNALSFIHKKNYKRIVVVDKKGELTGIISQKELISLTYNKWVILMKEYQDELSEINLMLEEKNHRYEKMASTDSLTGLYNRYKFSELYLSNYKIMMQSNKALSIIMLDLDFFKLINDNYGHNVGDTVLIQMAHILLRQLRNNDIICRWGGEEFLILLPAANLERSLNIAEKLRLTISKTEIEIVGCIQASFGVTEIIQGDSMETAIERADQALYRAKSSGRNCVKHKASPE